MRNAFVSPPVTLSASQWRQYSWQLAEHGLGPFVGAHQLAARVRQRHRAASAAVRLAALLRGEQRKQFGAATLLSALGPAALPASLPVGLFVATVLEARLALAAALLLDAPIEADAVRAALMAAVEQREPIKPQGPAAAWPWATMLWQWQGAWRPWVERAATSAKPWLQRRAIGRVSRRLHPALRAVPVLSSLVWASGEAKAMRAVLERVQQRLAPLGFAAPTLALPAARDPIALADDA